MDSTLSVLFDLSVILDALGRGDHPASHSAEVLAHAAECQMQGHLSAACIDTLNPADYRGTVLRVLAPTERLAELSPRHWTMHPTQPSASIH